jgi:hypothetical protein
MTNQAGSNRSAIVLARINTPVCKLALNFNQPDNQHIKILYTINQHIMKQGIKYLYYCNQACIYRFSSKESRTYNQPSSNNDAAIKQKLH